MKYSIGFKLNCKILKIYSIYQNSMLTVKLFSTKKENVNFSLYFHFYWKYICENSTILNIKVSLTFY